MLEGPRLWNLAPKILAEHRHSRVFEDQAELVDHILIGDTLLDWLESLDSHIDGSPRSPQTRAPAATPR